MNFMNGSRPSGYRVLCKAEFSCGEMDLTQDEYVRQINRPNDLWVCPKCKHPGHIIEPDDEEFEYELTN